MQCVIHVVFDCVVWPLSLFICLSILLHYRSVHCMTRCVLLTMFGGDDICDHYYLHYFLVHPGSNGSHG